LDSQRTLELHMTAIDAIFENGVFRPLAKVNLPEHSKVRISVSSWPEKIDPNHPQAGLWEVLSRRFRDADTRLAERHNEHQP
jgi:predicted DNA-binding antitoxin AbrB/MazE fold protein